MLHRNYSTVNNFFYFKSKLYPELFQTGILLAGRGTDLLDNVADKGLGQLHLDLVQLFGLNLGQVAFLQLGS